MDDEWKPIFLAKQTTRKLHFILNASATKLQHAKKKTVMRLKLFAFLCRDGVAVLRRPN